MRDKKILIVDFDEESLISLSNIVNEEGFRAVTATDGLSGYEKFKTGDFDLVIIEPMLPKLHGFELCKKISQDPVKKTPIIVVTGIYREPSCRLEALQVYGASAFFTKPWNKDELRSKMLELLVETKNAPAEPVVDERRSRPAPTPAPREVLAQKLTPKETRMSQGFDDIEKELQQAVSGLVSPTRKKVTKESEEPRQNVESEVEAMLKGAIGGLGLEETKKKPAAAKPQPRIAPAPAPAPKPDAWKDEPIVPVAREIRKSIPAEMSSVNKIPLKSSTVFDTETVPFGIDETLIEIEKIPFDLDKSPRDGGKKPPVEKEPSAESKKALFDEYAEPRKNKVTLVAVGALAAVIVIASSVTLIVLKSKKAAKPETQMVSSLTPSLPAEFSLRQQEIPAAETKQEAELRPALKKAPAKQAEEERSENVDFIRPVLPAEIMPAQIHVDVEATAEAPPTKSEETHAQPEAGPENSQPQPTPKPVEPGSLIPLAEVHVPPVLVKRVTPKYPPVALNMGMEGKVTVNALISETGQVVRTEILRAASGDYGFERAAENAVKQWVFRPARKDGVNVKVWKPIEIVFKLNQSPSKE
ncbi:MAG: TonB family protein [Clostridiales bacterium]|nr:TonB family protein [Clostridiales bacterium]